jgi:hypothetical protein
MHEHTPGTAGGRSSMKEINVIGTMQLLAACQKAPTVRRVVLKSTTAVYGSSSRDPALFDEAMTPKDFPSGGYAKDAVEIEGYLRGFARRRRLRRRLPLCLQRRQRGGKLDRGNELNSTAIAQAKQQIQHILANRVLAALEEDARVVFGRRRQVPAGIDGASLAGQKHPHVGNRRAAPDHAPQFLPQAIGEVVSEKKLVLDHENSPPFVLLLPSC